MENKPWESLDIDDYDLSSFVSPSFHNYTQTPTVVPCNSTSILNRPLIPGSAGAVQAIMLNRSSNNPIPSQDFESLVCQQDNMDFTTSAWLSALDFLQCEGYVDLSGVPMWTTLDSVKSIERAALVVAIVKTCTPNSFGSLKVTLKDPTRIIEATIHRKVFSHGGLQLHDIHVGYVVLLQQVVVFSPNRNKCYLNITLPNIMKAFSKESGPSPST